MARAKVAIVAPDKHRLRLIQQVPAGTPGAFVDPILNQSWLATTKGLNGTGGFVSVESDPILNDSSECTIVLQPQGSDGKNTTDRLYYFGNNPSGASYMPGDEWFEVIRGTNELVAAVTPISETSTPEQIDIVCRDVTAWLKKTRETSCGFWNNSPRDVFEHYTRCWRPILEDNFQYNATRFPVRSSNTTNFSTDGKWGYSGIDGSYSGQLLMAPSGRGVSAAIESLATVPDYGPTDHNCWRAECQFLTAWCPSAGPYTTLSLSLVDTISANTMAGLNISPGPGAVRAYSPATGAGPFRQIYWPVNAAGVVDHSGQLLAPWTLAIEARERFYYYFLDGQLVAVGDRTGTGSLQMRIEADINSGDAVTVQYAVLRETSPALNGGSAGDYVLPSPPEGGGLTGSYYDMTTVQASVGAPNVGGGGMCATPAQVPAAVRVDPTPYFTFAGDAQLDSPPWWPAAMAAAQAATIRWTGAIFLPLNTQDVHFQLVMGETFNAASLWIGKTRKGESILSTGGAALQVTRGESVSSYTGGGTGTLTYGPSVGMRSWLNTSKAGWFPLVFEFYYGGATAINNPGLIGVTYDVGGAGSVPQPWWLSPYGCFTQQVNPGDSHFDTIQTTIGEPFAYQWKSEPRHLESGSFPGVIVPRVRVGRDTDFALTEDQAVAPQETSTAQDNATTDLAQAQGLGGTGSGSLNAEAFNFSEMGLHPVVLTEAESLPGTSEQDLLVLQMQTLLALRSQVWQQVTADSIGQRQMQDSWPLTGVLQEFDWQPGDGLRIILPKVGVVDSTPRQIMSLKRMLYQDGMGTNSASFRARPRNFAYTMRRFIKQFYSSRRAFQGQLARQAGSLTASPAFSIVPLPQDTRLVRSAIINVTYIDTPGVNFQVFINGQSTGQVCYGPGPIDVSGLIAPNAGVQGQMVAQLTSPADVNGNPANAVAWYQLILTILTERSTR